MTITTPQILRQYQALCRLSTQILWQLHQAIKPGVTPIQIEQLANRLLAKHQVEAAFKGEGRPSNPYHHATCISVNEAVVHGIPNQRPFQKGDVIKVDFGVKRDNLITDHCFTVGLAPLAHEDERLILVSRRAVAEALKLAVAGNTTGDLGFAQESIVLKEGFNVAKGFIGHGIGHTMHDEPQLPAFGKKGEGDRLTEGMVLCIESQILAGEDNLEVAEDGWTIQTRDGSKAAMFEVMVVVGKKKPTILTPTLDWPVVV